MLPFRDNEKMLNVPLYGIATIKNLEKAETSGIYP